MKSDNCSGNSLSTLKDILLLIHIVLFQCSLYNLFKQTARSCLHSFVVELFCYVHLNGP